jgi:hypothetical protein
MFDICVISITVLVIVHQYACFSSLPISNKIFVERCAELSLITVSSN